MKLFILILHYSLFASANLNVEKWNAHAAIVENGKGIKVATPPRERHLSTVGGDFGFSFEKKTNEMGVCRLRLKVVCDYGLEFEKALKNTEVSMLIDGKILNGKTNLEGIMDGTFDCPTKTQNMNARLNVKKHQQNFVLKDSPGVIKIPEKVCR